MNLNDLWFFNHSRPKMVLIQFRDFLKISLGLLSQMHVINITPIGNQPFP